MQDTVYAGSDMDERPGPLGRLLARLLHGASGGVPVLDLHGLGVRDAVAATERFLHDCAADGAIRVRLAPPVR